MKVSSEAEFFKASDGSMIVCSPIYYLTSPDGRRFFEIHITQSGNTAHGFDVVFEDPYKGTIGAFRRKGRIIHLNDKVYEQCQSRSEIDVMPLPKIRKLEYLFRLPDGRHIYVSADKLNYSYESFKFFIGEPYKMVAVQIKEVSRLRDGGTTDIVTAEGELHSPTPFRGDEAATWTDKQLEKVKLKKLDPTQFEIKEDDSIASLSAVSV